jgi:uncharacterized protein DUF3987
MKSIADVEREVREAIERINPKAGRVHDKRETNGHGETKPPPREVRADNHVSSIRWPTPKPLPDGLAPVASFSLEFLPDGLAPWVGDIANRLQCPPEYPAVAAMVSLGAVLGRRLAIKPQMKTDWTEIPNLWGAFIGRPGQLKSPAMTEALRPIHHLEAEAAKDNEVARKAYEVGVTEFKLRQDVAKALAKIQLKAKAKGKGGDDAKINIETGAEPQEPLPRRYRTNDTTYEGLGELLIANPAGILVERDELVSLLQHLDREDQAVARGFYLSGWSGSQPYTFDRIGRGQRHIEAVCISVLGNSQPVRIAEYVRRANIGGAGGDGLIQRFGLMVWPDAPLEWKSVDEYPDARAREVAWLIFERASQLDASKALALGAELGRFDRVPSLRFDEAARTDFLGWHGDLERRLRNAEMSPALEGHLAKYRKLVPALALLNHFVDGQGGAVTQEALARALAFAEYLETHARRIYGSSNEGELAAGKAIIARCKNDDLKDGFTAREVHQRGWSHLTDRSQVQAGLSLLADLDYLAASVAPGTERGGRPKVTYAINPAIKPGARA